MMSRRAVLLLLAPAVLVMTALLVAPIAHLVRYSFYLVEAGDDLTGPLTLANYAKLVADPFYPRVFGKTLVLAAATTAISALTGYVLAHFMWKAPARWRGPLTILVLSPLLVSIVVSSYGWMVILGNNGLINAALQALRIIDKPIKLMFSEFAIVVGLVHIVTPFMVLSILAALERIEPVLEEAAATLGASRARVIRHVILPLALPGIGAGTTIVFSLAISAYVTPAVLGPSGPNFITTLIYNQFVTLLNWSFGAALAGILLAIALVIVFFYVRLLSRVGGLGHAKAAGG
jgi:putative spermidine/putrescine transport system permease protein